MGFFSKDRKKPSIQIHPGRSANKLGPALAPQDPVEDRRYSHQYGQHPSNNSTSQSTHIPSLGRSQSKRQSASARDRPTINVVSEERLERSSSLRPSSGILESIYYRGKPGSNPSSQPESPRVSHPRVLNATDEYPPDPQHSYSESPSSGTAQSTEPRAACQQRGPHPSHPAHTQDNSQLSQQNQNPVNPSRYTQPLTLRTENLAAEITPQTTHSSATDNSASLNQETHRAFTTQEPVLTRPSSQSREPLSPTQSNHPDAPQPQTQAQSDTQSAASPQQDRPRRGSVSNMPENGRGTPTAMHHREDLGEPDFRALLQKHEELQMKYAKVKRYYFEKEAQVTHLQNTVANQRLAVSRTVLDDNEYTNRFERLDGAIKNLAVLVREEWRSIPEWLHGMVTDNAVPTGGKEMIAVGRVVISRWLVDEVFQRHFHPALDPSFSISLKKIEMNLRRQPPTSDEERENASAKISYWRRTTLDGLSDCLNSEEAEGHRSRLFENLKDQLVSFMGEQLKEPAKPVLEASVPMIIEKSIDIIGKIPLEARDVCVDYFPPNTPLSDHYMKVEGTLPPLSQPGSGGKKLEKSNSTIESPSVPQRQRKSIFPHIGSTTSSNDGRTAQAEEVPESRIRFAAFPAVEVRGKEQATTLIKAPVWLVT